MGFGSPSPDEVLLHLREGMSSPSPPPRSPRSQGGGHGAGCRPRLDPAPPFFSAAVARSFPVKSAKYPASLQRPPLAQAWRHAVGIFRLQECLNLLQSGLGQGVRGEELRLAV